MLFRRWMLRWTLCAAAGLAAGCSHSSDKLCYLGDADLKHYRDKATRVDHTCVKDPAAPDIVATEEPRTVADRRKDEIYDIALVECLHTALANNRIIRTAGQFLAIGGNLYTNPNGIASVYDPAIQDSGVLFGGRGVEAALSDFDAQFTSSATWGKDERVQNVAASPYGPGFTNKTDTAAVTARLQKTTAYGGIIGIQDQVNYLYTNTPGTLFPSTYTGQLSMDYRQPLWAGSGVEYTRIAGPLNATFSAITGVSQGVAISRINEDISIADFELSVRNMLKDVEDTYWNLYLAYRTYDTAVVARNSALRTWREQKLQLTVGKGDPADEAQARDGYFNARSSVDSALSNIYNTELQLRRIIGLPVNDGKVMRPKDEPTSAEFVGDWRTSLAEALTRRVELRRQKWNIKSLELQLIAARSLTNPRFDFVSQYRVNAFGDKLVGSPNDGITANGLGSYTGTLTDGDQTGWNLGFEFSAPIGFRSAHAQVRNIELRLAKAREVLAIQELEISHELGSAFQNVAANYATTKDNFNRRIAAAERVRLFTERERVGTVTTDLVLRAQASLADAQVAYFTSLTNYNKSLTDFFFRKGMLLEHNNVRIAEDRWTPDAYKEALRRAWARSHAIPNPFLDTEPAEFATPRGPDPGALIGAPGSIGDFADENVAPNRANPDAPKSELPNPEEPAVPKEPMEKAPMDDAKEAWNPLGTKRGGSGLASAFRRDDDADSGSSSKVRMAGLDDADDSRRQYPKMQAYDDSASPVPKPKMKLAPKPDSKFDEPHLPTDVGSFPRALKSPARSASDDAARVPISSDWSSTPSTSKPVRRPLFGGLTGGTDSDDESLDKIIENLNDR